MNVSHFPGRGAKPRCARSGYVALIAIAFLVLWVVGRSDRARAQGAWQPIPCSRSGVSISPMEKCFKGRLNPTTGTRCTFDLYRAFANTKQIAVYARAAVVSAATPSCWVEADPNFAREFPKSLPLLREHATNWSKMTEVSQTTGMYFDLPHRHCFAYYTVERPWRSGYKSSVRGFVCGSLGSAPLTTDQIAAFLSRVRVDAP